MYPYLTHIHTHTHTHTHNLNSLYSSLHFPVSVLFFPLESLLLHISNLPHIPPFPSLFLLCCRPSLLFCSSFSSTFHFSALLFSSFFSSLLCSSPFSLFLFSSLLSSLLISPSGSLEGRRERKSYKALLEDPMLRFSGLYQETCSDLYVTSQVFAEGKPLALPVRTSYKAFSTRWK